MKKQNEVKNETTKQMKQPKQRMPKLFFLFVNGKGFIRLDDTTGPQFETGKLACFTTRLEAKHARNFFVMMHVADNIDIMAKVG